jgi:4-diphosphocytidyl-2-C-methyl-D-erythritol kinase
MPTKCQQSGPRFATAHAKINVTLEVLGKRDDGYHNLASIMQTIALHDTLALTSTADGRIELFCDLPELNSGDNLVVQAARRLRQEAGKSDLGARIELHKEIPAPGGLGGGSSDAAVVLIHLNELWEVGISRSRLLDLAAELGSDIPFFITGGTALIRGRGEDVTPLPPAEPFWLLLVKPGFGVSTRQVFADLSPEDYGDGSATAAVEAAIRENRPIPFQNLSNSLESGVMGAFPQLAELRSRLLASGAELVCMSGSGPTLFAPFRSLEAAKKVYRSARESDLPVGLTHTV